MKKQNILQTILSSIILSLFILSSCSEKYDVCDLDKDGAVGSAEEKKCERPSILIESDKKESKNDTYNYTYESYTYDGKTKIYVLINSHNEDSWRVDTEKLYTEYRNDLVERLQIIQAYGAKLNWQTDIPVVEAMLQFEDEDLFTKTNGKNILQYMVEDLGFSVDPHFHKKEGYSYADVAYIIEQLGVEPSNVIGGVRVFDCGNDPKNPIRGIDWHEELELEDDGYVYGRAYPTYRWKPEILSGAAASGHFGDDHTSGAWKPGNSEDFYDHQDDGQIIYIGEGYSHDQTLIGPAHASGVEILYSDAGYVKELVEKLITGDIPSGEFYSALIHVRDKKKVQEGGATIITNEALRDILEELKPYHEQGIIEYVTYQEAVEIWEEAFGAKSTQLFFEEFSKYNEEQESIQKECF